MTSIEQRQQRVANGSRRKRDLEAVKPDFSTFAAQLPDELPHRVRTAAMRLYVAKRHVMPTPEEVLAHLEARGQTKAQIEAEYGVGTQ